MKKHINYFCLTLFIFILFTNKVLAADFSISLTSNTVTVGNTVTLKIDGTASGLTGRFNISSSNSSVASLSSSNVWLENSTEKITITAKSAGTAVITVSPTDGISDKDANEPKLKARTITITVNAKQAQPATNNNQSSGGSSYTQTKAKSSNNFLSSLTIDGLSLNEPFDKEKLEYTLTVPSETEKIKINAQLADSNAKVTGTGEQKVSTGLNVFELVVTAENGSKKTYTIKATVEELKPIEITIDNEKYSLIRKRKDLPKISEYNVEKDFTIEENIIEGYHNESLNYDLVGLKDSLGKIKYYIYKNNKYTLYNEHTFNGTTLQILDKAIPGYKKVSFIYDEDKIESYQEVKINLLKNTYALDNNDIAGNQFYLFYAKNIETGKENLYQYDALEKTIQRYNLEVLDMYKETSNTYYKYLIMSILVIGILIIALNIALIKNTKNNNKSSKKIKKKEALEI